MSTIESSFSVMEVLSGRSDGAGRGDFAIHLLDAVRESDLDPIWWGGAFFNWYLECSGPDATLEEAAEAFHKLLPNCPMTVQELCADYEARE
jgi:hypothetical protein